MKIRILLLIGLFMVAACTAEVAEEPAAMAVPTTVPTAILPTSTVAIAENIVEATAVPTNPPPPTDEPASAESTELPLIEPLPTAMPEEEPVVVEYGRTAEGAYFQGVSDAPVTFIDYSDFL